MQDSDTNNNQSDRENPEEKPPPSAETPAPDQAETDGFNTHDVLQGLLEISYLVGSVMELDHILQEIVRITSRVFDTPVCTIYMFGPRRQNLTLRATVGPGRDPNEYIGQSVLPIGRGLPGIAAQNNELIAVPDASRDPRHETPHGNKDDQSHAYICAPFRIQDEVLGVLTARRDCAVGFTKADCTLFETICKQIAIVMEKSQMHFEKEEANRMAAISISLSEVAHYIKNLLQGMKGGIYFVDLGLKRGDLDTARKGWGVLQRGNRKIASLVENMLNYSRTINLELESHNVNSILYEILHQIDDTVAERGITLETDTDPNLPNTQLDYDKIYDAFLNLIGNALDAIPQESADGVVTVRSRLLEDENIIEVAVEDNGNGMPDEVRDKVFNLFYSTKGGQGTGIGLSVTRKIIEQHKGNIAVESEEGKGTVFTIQLPLVHEDETSLAED